MRATLNDYVYFPFRAFQRNVRLCITLVGLRIAVARRIPLFIWQSLRTALLAFGVKVCICLSKLFEQNLRSLVVDSGSETALERVAALLHLHNLLHRPHTIVQESFTRLYYSVCKRHCFDDVLRRTKNFHRT